MISLINAGPGTGKSFSLIYGYLTLSQKLVSPISPTDEQQEIFNYMKEEFPPHSRVCFFAHSNTVKDHLTRSLGKKGAKIFTFHGAGQSCIIKRYGFQRLVRNRTEQHIRQITGQDFRDLTWEDKKFWAAIKRIVHYLKIECLPPKESSLTYLLQKYPDLSSYAVPERWIYWAEQLLEKAARPDGTIEFADMLWLGKQCIRSPMYDLGLVDESQDISMASYQLVTRMCKNVIFCGDKNQAINAFAGASEEMYDNIAAKADAILPLKVTQRCPPDICDLANTTRPGGILYGPNKQKSDIDDVPLDSLPGKLIGKVNPENTLLLSRTNSAIINCTLYLRRKGIQCQIIDKDLADEINRFVKTFGCDSILSLQRALKAWMGRNEKVMNPIWVHLCKDKMECIWSFTEQVETMDDLLSLVKDTFEPQKKGFKLTTVHKAKGLEAENIFIIKPPIPLQLAMSHPISREQEINLKFVAETRSSLNLYYVK